MEAGKGAVCLTGAGGFIGSWVVHLLLSKGYTVHGALSRDPSDDKYAHLKQLVIPSKATSCSSDEGGLKLFKADLMDYAALVSAIQGCTGVIHVACPVPSDHSSLQNPQAELVEPAVRGTMNVMKACAEAKVKKVVIVSSASAIASNPTWLHGSSNVMDETCWSDKAHCRATEDWYSLAKTEAEWTAFEYGKEAGIEVFSICPTLVIGPILQPTLNTSTLIFANLLKERMESLNDYPLMRMAVDVRDVAEAIVLAYEKPEAEGRYICTAYLLRMQEMVELLKPHYPHLNYPTHFTEVYPNVELSAEKLKRLGWSYHPIRKALVDSVESYRKTGILD